MSEGDGCVTVKLLFFAKARELSGQKETLIEVAETITGGELLDFVVTKFKLDCIRNNVILALNEDWVDLNDLLKLHNQDELAIVPPLSGGKDKTESSFLHKKNKFLEMDHVKLTNDKLNIEEIYSLVCSPEYGAVALFVGTTRDNFEGKVVEKLEYEAYDKMAVKALDGICKKIRQKYELGNIAIVHRLGEVPVQEASVVIAISAPHRKPVFDALSFAIDSLKADVPIWKKEVYLDDISPQWKENAESADITRCMTDNPDCIQMQEEVVEAENVDHQVSPDLIQINTNAQEINRRIMAFMDRKRHQMNVSNIEDFCQERSDSTCARTNAVLFRRKDSKTHLKVHRVENITGPQIRKTELSSKATETLLESGTCPPGAVERLANAEEFLNVKNDSLNVFKRLKAIEDKILFLESISPEYFDFAKQIKPAEKSPVGKKKYSSEDIDMRLNNLKSKFLKK